MTDQLPPVSYYGDVAFMFFHDPAHGWLAVLESQAAAVGLSAADFSRYSYTRNGCFYLEEDCDAPKLLAAWKRTYPKARIDIVDEHHRGDSPIRSYQRIR